MRRVATIIILLCQLSPGLAEDVHMLGADSNSTCGTWSASRDSDHNWIAMANWALGYLSGAAVFSTHLDPLKGLDSDAVLYWLDNYCRAQPLETFPHAVRAFAREHPK